MAALPIVRRTVRDLLESSPGFNALPAHRRKRVESDTVRVAAYMADPDGLVSREFRSPLLARGSARRARVRTVMLAPTLRSGSAALDALVTDLDFPDFVGALIHGVFDAIVDASIQQMQAYAALIANVAASVDEFIAESISDRAARESLIEEFPDVFCSTGAQARLAWHDHIEPAALARLQAALGLPGRVQPDLRRLVAATRRRLARNRQQALATIVSMGIGRIVVSDGRLAPRIRFDLVRR